MQSINYFHIKKYKVGILGATGIVGQRFIQLLINHPYFEIQELGASEKSVGKFYKDSCSWKLNENIIIPEYIQNKIIKSCIPNNFKNCDLVFSALQSDISGSIEECFFLADIPIISNSSFYRMKEDIPLIVPYINNDHLQLIHQQRKKYNLKNGFLLTNANCATTGLLYSIYNLHKIFKIKHMNVVTLQSVSGAGYTGVNSYDIISNVIPYIENEEEKIKYEPLKIFGNLVTINDELKIEPNKITIDATCNRVDVIDGHTECISLKFEEDINRLSIQEIKEIILQNSNMIRIFDINNRPQPRLDVNFMNGYGISIGRLRKGDYWDLEMTILLNNTIIGAAGSAILNAEICVNNNFINNINN